MPRPWQTNTTLPRGPLDWHLGGKSREEGVELAAKWIDGLRRQHTPYGSLSAAGISAADIPQMVESALSVQRLLEPNPVAVEADDAARIYQNALN